MLLAEETSIHRELRQAAARLPSSARILERVNRALRNPDVDIREITAPTQMTIVRQRLACC